MKKKFLKIHEEYSVAPLTQLMNFGYPSEEMEKILRRPKITMICHYQGFHVSFYFVEEEWKQSGNHIIGMVARDRKTVEYLLRRSSVLTHKALGTLQSISWEKIGGLSDKKLYQTLKTLTNQAFLLSVYSELGAIADHWHGLFLQRMEDEVLHHSRFQPEKQSLQKVISELNVSDKPYPSDSAKEEMIGLKKQINKTPQKKKELLEKFLQRWFWISYGQIGPGQTHALFENDIRKKINLTDFVGIKKRQAELEKSLELNAIQKNLFYASRNFAFLKGVRAEVCGGVCAFIHKVVEKVSLNTGIKKEHLFYLSLSELLQYLKSQDLPSEKILAERLLSSVWIPENVFQVKILSGRAAKKFLETSTIISERTQEKEQEEVKGNVAFAGIVTGQVRIINEPNQMEKMQKGDVLVAIQTTPELLPAMKKAAAFVTDIGGIISHAAVVAREFKIPCIVGTKIATKVFHDGDVVEVDANVGIIKVIKKWKTN